MLIKGSRAGAIDDRASAEHLDSMLCRARAGDRAALASLLDALRPLMYHVAHRRATPRMPADDLVATATLRFIEALSRGGGPTSNPGAYITASIRNLAVDHGKRRESANVSLEAGVGERHLAVSPHDNSTVELLLERSAVRAAFVRLSPAQRKVLHETAVLGRTPAEVASEQGQRANTVSAQASRARAALAVELRSVMLARIGAHECEPFRAELAQSGSASTPAAQEHLDACARCQRALVSFTAIPSVLSALPLVLVGGASVAAAVAAGSAASGAAASGAAAAASGAAASTTTGTGTAGLSMLLSTSAARGAAALVLVGAGVAAAAGAIWLDEPRPTQLQSPIALSVSTVQTGAAASIDVDIDAHVEVEGPLSVTIDLPETIEVTRAPIGWDCSVGVGGGSCDVPVEHPDGAFSVSGIDGAASGRYSVTVSAAEGPMTATGIARGSIDVQ